MANIRKYRIKKHKKTSIEGPLYSVFNDLVKFLKNKCGTNAEIQMIQDLETQFNQETAVRVIMNGHWDIRASESM